MTSQDANHIIGGGDFLGGPNGVVRGLNDAEGATRVSNSGALKGKWALKSAPGGDLLGRGRGVSR